MGRSVGVKCNQYTESVEGKKRFQDWKFVKVTISEGGPENLENKENLRG